MPVQGCGGCGGLKRLRPAAHAPEVGCLASYGIKLSEGWAMLAALTDKMLKGAPGEIPAQQPTKFELAINLKTAKQLGITIPQSLLLRADEVIQ